ncbi:MAG: ferredoxin--NADP reductase [Planctomycetota bacterium]|jgi:ferredoxin-NADP reductase
MDWYDVTITRVVDETPMDRSFSMSTPDGHADAFRFVPGQFVLVRDPEDETPRQRAYSISSSPNEAGAFQVTVRDTGGFGDRFFSFAAGKHLRVTAPSGGFVLDRDGGHRLVLAGGGSGVAPYRAFVRYLREEGHEDPVVLVSSAREPAQLLFHEEFLRHDAECAWFRYVPTVTRRPDGVPWEGRQGRVDLTLLRELAPVPDGLLTYACGPTAFVEAWVAYSESLGLPAGNIRREKWG